MVTTCAALVLSSYVALALLIAILVAGPAVTAGVVAPVARRTAVVALPVVLALTLVSVLTRTGTTVLFELGPFDATLEGVDFAARVALRLVAMAGALTLFGLTTPIRAIVADLERRGLAPGATYAVAAVLDAAPAMLRRARLVTEAQRARGLDTEGGAGARLRGVIPIVGPTVLASLHDVEARSIALEARGFGRPGPRRPLWAPADRSAERAGRWILVIGLVLLVAGSIAGVLPQLP